MATMISPPPMHSPDEYDSPEVRSIVAAWYAGSIGRRQFIARASAVLGSLAAATTLLAACGGTTATTAPTIAATRAATTAAGSSTAGAAATTAPTVAAGSATTVPAAVTAAPAATTAAGTTTVGTVAAGSATTGTRPAGSAPSGTAAGTAQVSAVATGVPTDAVNAKTVTFKNGTADITAYETRPKTGTPTAAVIVIHENTGLTDHIKDVTRRVAKEGYIGLGIDLLSRVGTTGAFKTPQDATAEINKLSDEQMISDVNAGVAYLKGQSGIGKVGIVGFCFGGRVVLIAAEKAQGLDAASAYYGPPTGGQPPLRTVDPTKEAASLTCPLMGNYGGMDPAIPVAAVQALETAAKSSGKPVDIKIFENAGHAFNNDTRPFNGGVGYLPGPATEAWTRTLGWFKKYLA